MRILVQRIRLTKRLFLLGSALLLLGSTCAYGQLPVQILYLSNLAGQPDRNTILTGRVVRIEIGLYNITEHGDGLVGISNAFTVSSADGAHWGSVSGRFADTITSDLLGYQRTEVYSGDGAGRDTIAFWGTRDSYSCGLPKYYIGPGYYIDIGPFPASDNGKTVTIDSCMLTPMDKWVWVVGECDIVRGTYSPDWNGPYTFSIVDSIATGVGAVDPVLPERTSLSANWPNPFNPSTQFEMTVADPGRVLLTIHDLLGRKIRTLLDRTQAPGSYVITWDGLDQTGSDVPSGVYLARLITRDCQTTRKILKLK